MENEKQSMKSSNLNAQSQSFQNPDLQSALADIRNSYGFIPEFVDSMPVQAIPGAWNEVKNLFYNRNTSIEPKMKDLIGLAVGVQQPSELLTDINRAIAEADGCTSQEASEAALMAAVTRHWSTVLNGSLIDKAEFRKEVDQIMSYTAQMLKKSHGQLPPEENFIVNFSSASEAYEDMKKTLGRVPKFFAVFPEEGICGAWSEFKAVQLNPHTAIDNQHKELIGVAVAAQIPCDYCVYFHTSAARLFGATDKQIKEAVAISALARHWATVFHASQMTVDTFRDTSKRMVLGATSKVQLHS